MATRCPPSCWCIVLVAMAACTYGPAEERATVSQIVRLGDSFRAVALIRRDVFQRPTGLNTFPDGGRWRSLERQAFQVLLDVEAGQAVLLASQQAADSLWESFDAHISGVIGDSLLYLSLTGCPRDGECYPTLANREWLLLHIRDGTRSVNGVPAAAVLPGGMLARAPGELHYVRFRTSQDTIAVKLQEDRPYQPMFHVRSDGTVVTIGGQ